MARMLIAGFFVIQTLTYEPGYGKSDVVNRSEYIRAAFYLPYLPVTNIWLMLQI